MIVEVVPLLTGPCHIILLLWLCILNYLYLRERDDFFDQLVCVFLEFGINTERMVLISTKNYTSRNTVFTLVYPFPNYNPHPI